MKPSDLVKADLKIHILNIDDGEVTIVIDLTEQNGDRILTLPEMYCHAGSNIAFKGIRLQDEAFSNPKGYIVKKKIKLLN